MAGACGPDGCVKPVQQCPPGLKCISYDEYCDQAPASLWTMGQVCGVVAPDVPYPAGFPQRDRRCTGELARLIDAGAVSFNAVAAELCLESRKTSCDPVCRWNFEEGVEVARCSPPCDRIFTGLKQTGEKCSLSAECLDGLWCDTTRSCPGRCARQISSGEPTPSLEACRSPLVTVLVDGGLRCDSLRDAGARCALADDELTFHHCQPGYACDHPRPEQPDAGDGGSDAGGDAGASDGGPDGGPDAGTADGGLAPPVCVAWADAGASPAAACASAGCPFGQLCIGQVVPRQSCAPLRSAGKLCFEGSIEPQGWPCLIGLQCIPDGGDSFCGEATTGSACLVDADCDPGSWCGADGGCAPKSALGGRCDPSVPCAGELVCLHSGDAGTCFTRSLAGQACGDSAGHQCAWGFDCHDGGCVESACLPSP